MKADIKKRKLLRPLKQVGKSDRLVDSLIPALRPGKRVSETGNTYWETRKNRSDKKGSRV